MRRRRLLPLAVSVIALAAASCSTTPPPPSLPSPPAVSERPSGSPGTDPNHVMVVFDSPGADPRPLKETPVALTGPTTHLGMSITDLSYRGVVCGFTFTGTRPTSPVTIVVAGKLKAGAFTSGEVLIRWSDAGVVETGQVQSDNGWSFSADAYPNRNGPGWAVSIGAVTGEGDDVIPTAASCTLKAAGSSGAPPFVPANGPVGYWAGFATR